MSASVIADRDLTTVWKALADPRRRAMLDLLRDRPMTTGEVALHFDVTRFGVMKHLSVLVDAGLVLVRRRGRERWNHLNPIPIQQIHERWIRPYEIESAQRLLRLKAIAEQTLEEGTMSEISERVFRTVDIHQELRVEASPSHVWEALTSQIGSWWPASFYVGSSPIRFSLEARVGGRVFEDWGDGEGALWATVSGVRRGEMLQWAGDLAAEFGGPGRSITTFTLEPDGDQTLVKFRDTMFGELSDEMQGNLETGWSFLLNDCFKPFAEVGTKPDRPESVVAAEQ